MVITLAVMAGCSSSDGGDSAKPSNSSGPSTTAGSSGLKAAKAYATAAEKTPTQIGVSTPLSSKPPTGKTFVYIKCELTGCPGTEQGVAAATAALGWKLKVLNFTSSNPASLVSAMKLALRYNPVGVGFSGLGENLWASEVPEYKAAGVPIIPFAADPVTIDGTVIASLGGAADNLVYGKMLASWFISTSNGKGRALLVNVPDFGILQSVVKGFTEAVSNWCPGCSVTTMNESIPDATGGQLVPATVSALRKDPSLNYAVSVYGPFFDGLPAALASAGLGTKIKIAGQGGDVVNLTDAKNGREVGAYTANAFVIAGWSMVDRAARHLDGTKIDQSATLPTQLLATGEDYKLTDQYLYPADYADQFKKLWLVG